MDEEGRKAKSKNRIQSSKSDRMSHICTFSKVLL